MGRSFRFTQANSAPFSGLDGTVIFSDGTATDKIRLIAATGLGAPTLQTQTQKAPFQQGASLIRTQFQPRTITLECAISVPAASSTGLAEVTTIKRSVSHKLSPVGMGFLPQTSLSSSTYSTYLGLLEYASDGVTYDRFIDVVPMAVEYPNAYYKDGFQKMRVVFFCPDPFWYGAEQTAAMSQVGLAVVAAWADVCWSSELGIFCAVGAAGSVMTSPDGITWTDHSIATADNLTAIAWSPELSLFCVMASATTNIRTSPDGITWTDRTGDNFAVNSVCWAPEIELFCAVGLGGISQSSPDGITWTAHSTGTSVSLYSICWSPQLRLFCAIANSSTSIRTSPDGTNWTNRTGVSVSNWNDVAWSPELGLFCAVANNTDSIQTSPDGITWTLRTGSSNDTWVTIAWSSELLIFCAVAQASTAIQTSVDGINWTARTGLTTYSWISIAWAPEIGAFCVVPSGAMTYPQISYDGINWIGNSATTDWYLSTSNTGDVPAEFEIDIPVVGGETGKVVAIGENFLWAGSGDPPSDHNIVFSTEGLKTGTVTLSTKFGAKTITQFNLSVLNKFVGGTFFTLYVTGSASNILYLRNTGTPAGAPTLTWRNRYIGV